MRFFLVSLLVKDIRVMYEENVFIICFFFFSFIWRFLYAFLRVFVSSPFDRFFSSTYYINWIEWTLLQKYLIFVVQRPTQILLVIPSCALKLDQNNFGRAWN